MAVNDTIIIVVSSIGGVLICCFAVTCCCLYYFWNKNRRLIREQKREEQQQLNGHKSPNTSNTASHSQPNHPNRPPSLPVTTGSNRVHSAEETTNSSGFNNINMNMNPDWNMNEPKYDVNFLVHPENYVPSSQASNSGNGEHVLAVNHGSLTNPVHIGNRLTATVTNSGHSSHLAQNMAIAQQNRYNQYQNQQRHLQRKKLMEIVKNARNKLQMIDSKHISFEYEVGRGKFGKVFRALWTDTTTKLQKTVAVKWFKQDEVDSEVFEDFVKEISVAAHLPPHDNVLQIYGFCVSPYALVTEFVNGGSVEICVSCKHGKNMRNGLTIGDVVQMFIDTACGISHLHTVNIIHRDVASRNLLIQNLAMDSNVIWEERDPSQKRRVVVCDFGLSRITQNPDQDNMTNSHVGPLKWMSPESIKQQIYNSKTDVYSFGIVMWEVLCGMPPYPSTKVLSLAVEVISKQTRPYVLEWFPRPLKILMQRCWQEVPAFRPTFEDIKNELNMFKQELIRQKRQNQPLITLSSAELNERGKTKEKLRNLNDLCNKYLNTDKHHWDKLIKPKLKGLIQAYNDLNDQKMNAAQSLAQQNMQRNTQSKNQRLDLNNNGSESTYYDEQISVMQRMNISNRRISTEFMNGEHVLAINQSPKVSRVRFNDIAINAQQNPSINNNNKILPLTANTSLSVEDEIIDNTHKEQRTKPVLHNLGDSVQIQ